MFITIIIKFKCLIGKSGIYIGRFQPFHEGHKKLFENILKKNSQVAILVMDSLYKQKNPLNFQW